MVATPIFLCTTSTSSRSSSYAPVPCTLQPTPPPPSSSPASQTKPQPSSTSNIPSHMQIYRHGETERTAAAGRVISLNLSSIDVAIHRVDPALLNLTSLKILSLSTTRISEGLSSLSKLPSLNTLELHGSSSRDPVGPELSSVGDIKQLTSLRLEAYDFSQSQPSWIANLTGLVYQFDKVGDPRLPASWVNPLGNRKLDPA